MDAAASNSRRERNVNADPFGGGALWLCGPFPVFFAARLPSAISHQPSAILWFRISHVARTGLHANAAILDAHLQPMPSATGDVFG